MTYPSYAYAGFFTHSIKVHRLLNYLYEKYAMFHQWLMARGQNRKGWGGRGNFHWRAPETYFMTTSLVKFTYSLICKVLVCFLE